jgi:4-amino-4-deoxy-L-arabinose transferase-like glycosyltransferase
MFTDHPGPAAASVPWRRDLLVLAAVFGALYFALLGGHPLSNPDEGRYAAIPREMIATGDYVTPRLNGVNYFEKPPLLYWAVAGCFRVFGYNEWAVRMMPALSGLFGVLLTYAATRAWRGRAAGFAAAVVLGSSLLIFALSRILILDMAVAMLMCATLFCFILGVRETPGTRRRWFFYGLYASAALATLTKGLIGFLVTGAVMFLWLLIFNQWKRLRPLHLPSGIALFLAIAAPWHILAAQRNDTWAQFYFVHEHWERFTTTTHGRYEPWWYFIPIVIFGLFPWMGFLPAALREALAGGWAKRKENADAWFLVVWAGFIFLFFSKSQSKLIPYILPVFPPLAVLIGGWIARRWADGAVKSLRLGLNLFAFLSGLLAVALVIAVVKPGVIREPGQAEQLRPYAFGMAAVLMLGGVTAPWFARVRGLRAGLSTMVSTAVGLYFCLMLAAPYIQKPGTKELAALVVQKAKPGDKVYHYAEFFHDFTFYAHQTVGTVAFKGELELEIDAAARASGRFIDGPEFHRQWAQPGRIFAVARTKDLKTLFADPTFHYHLLGQSQAHTLFSNQP